MFPCFLVCLLCYCGLCWKLVQICKPGSTTYLRQHGLLPTSDYLLYKWLCCWIHEYQSWHKRSPKCHLQPRKWGKRAGTLVLLLRRKHQALYCVMHPPWLISLMNCPSLSTADRILQTALYCASPKLGWMQVSPLYRTEASHKRKGWVVCFYINKRQRTGNTDLMGLLFGVGDAHY